MKYLKEILVVPVFIIAMLLLVVAKFYELVASIMNEYFKDTYVYKMSVDTVCDIEDANFRI